MIPRTQAHPQGPQNGDLKPEDLLTAQDAVQNPFSPNSLKKTAMEQPNMEDDQRLTSSQKSQIASDVLAKKLDQEDIEEMFEREIASPREQGIPETPEEIFKTIISQGEYSETVEVAGHRWTIKALNHGELIAALDGVKDTLASQAGRVTALMFEQVLYAITAINGVSIYEWFPKIKRSDYPSVSSYKEAVRNGFRVFLTKFPPEIIDGLYGFYNEIEQKRKGAMERLKNS